METALLTRELLEVVDTINRKEILSKLKIFLKGEDLFIVMLSEMGGISTPSKVVEDSDFSPARLSAILKTLEGKGYIKKKQDEIDKRCTIIEITDRGIERSDNIRREMVCNAVDIIEKLGETDATEFIRLTKKLVSVLNES